VSAFTPWFNCLVIEAGRHRQERPYEILAAVRGPDVDLGEYDTLQGYPTDQIKDLVTARVRAIVFEESSVTEGSLYCSKPFDAEDLDDLKRLMDEVGRHKEARHFLQHLRRAVQASHEHPIWAQYAGEIIEVLQWVVNY